MKLSGDTARVTGLQLSYVPLSMSEGRRVPVPSGPRTMVKGFKLITGGIRSLTVTVAVHDELLPEASVAVTVTGTGAPMLEHVKVERLRV